MTKRRRASGRTAAAKAEPPSRPAPPWRGLLAMAAVLSLTAALLFVLWRRAPHGGPPSQLLLVTIDTWRLDHLGATGSGKAPTPNLDALARDGFLSEAWSPAPLTTPAHASLMTGLLPHGSGIRDNLHYRLQEEAPTLAASFLEAGFRTAAFVSATPLARHYGLDRGFELYDDEGLARSEELSMEPAERKADATVARAIGWIERQPGDAKAFLWVHLYDPHAPYVPPSRHRRAELTPYASEVAFADEQVGLLVEAFRRRFSRAAIVVTSDHGEGLGEHGEMTHGVRLHRATLAVPLVIWPAPAGGIATPRRPSLCDVAPTLRDWAGLPEVRSDGSSLLRPEPGRFLYAEAAFPALAFGVVPGYRIQQGERAWVKHATASVYDVGDPRESAPIADEGFAERARRQLAEIHAGHPEELLFRSAEAPPAGLEAALGALGYVSATSGARRDLRPLDHGELLRDMGVLEQAREALRVRDLGRAAFLFTSFLERFPDAAVAHQELGVVHVVAGDRAKARASFERALALDPGDAVSALNLGNIQWMAGELEAARRSFELSLQLEPNQPEAHLNHAQVLIALGAKAEAAAHLRAFVRLVPRDPEAAKAAALAEQLEGR